MGRLVLVWVHVLSAMVWVGGLVYGSHLVVPALARGERAHAALLRQGRVISASALGLLAATGLANWALLGLRSYWLMGKFLLVLVIVPLAVNRDFGLLPVALRSIEQGGDPKAALSGVRAVDRVLVVLALAVLFLAVGIARGR
jgi:uncharacterized membrane protein